MRDDVHARRIEPAEERLAILLGLVDETQGKVADLVIHRLHSLRIKRAGILDLLFAYFAPARHVSGVIRSGRPGMNHVAWADLVQQILRVVRMRRVFHCIGVIEVAKEFVEAVNGGQNLVLVAKVVLAELAGGVALRFERSRDGASLCGQSDRRAGLADRRHARSNWKFASDEACPTRRATRLRLALGEQHASLSRLLAIWCPARHHAAMAGAAVPPPDIIAHDNADVALRVSR